MSQTKRKSTGREKAGDASPEHRRALDSSPPGRRFTPSLKNVTEGGRVYGGLIADKRERCGLSQSELAVKIGTSTATVARIEEGHPPGAELSKKLNEVLTPEPPNSPMRRLASSVAMPHPTEVARDTMERIPRLRRVPRPPHVSRQRGPGNSPQLSFGSRRIWGAIAILLAVVILAVAGSQLLSGDSAPSRQPFVKVSSGLGAPASIHRARVEAHKEAVAESRRAAREERAREQAAAEAAAAAAARKAKKAAAAERNSSTPTTPAPVVTSPPPSSGDGGSSAPAPELQHGIGSGGGLSGN